MKKIVGLTAFIFIIIISTFGARAFAIETAPRISDKEIIEGITELKTTQKAILQKFEEINRRFEQVDKQFEQVDKRFELVDKRFDQINKRFDYYRKTF